MKKEEKEMLEALDADFEACRKEYEDAPKLSDEGIDRILKDISKQARMRSTEKRMS